MSKYRIKTIINAAGEKVDDSYECVKRFNLDGGTTTTDINKAFKVVEMVRKDCPRGIYEIEEVKIRRR